MDLVEVEKRNEAAITARHPWELARFEVVNNLLKGIIKNEEGFTVLDIGCGDIFFVSGLSERYPKATFMAIDTAFTNEIMQKLEATIKGKNIHLFKTLDEVNKQLKSKADLVLLLDVVEHIGDDKGFLKSLYGNEAVTTDTRIMITVPAFQSLFCSHDRFLGHFRRYTNRSLLATIRSAGFEKVKLGYFFSLLVLPRMLQVLKEKITKPATSGETTGLVEWSGGFLKTGLFKGLLLTDAAVTGGIKSLTGLSVPGLSNYIICKKPA